MPHQIVRYARNLVGRDLIVGDIHGCFRKLQVALQEIGFNPAADRLFSVGDLVDRGPDSDWVGEWLDLPWFHAIRGNHEEAAIQYAEGKLDPGHYVAGFGGAWNVMNPREEQQRIADLFRPLPLAIELETRNGLVAIVHADCPLDDWGKVRDVLDAGGPLARSLADCMQWSRDRADRLLDDPVAGVRAVVVGHTPMQRMTSLGNTLFIDTFAWLRGHFTIIDAETLRPVGAAPARALDWS